MKGNEKYKLVITGESKVNCGCVIIKTLGSKGFKMKIDTSKLTIKDFGEYTIQTDISLEENEFATERQFFNLSITAATDDPSKSLDSVSSRPV